MNLDDQLKDLLSPKPHKTYIGIISSHDSDPANKSLKKLLEKLCTTITYSKKIEDYGFVFSGGTFHRLITGKEDDGKYEISDKAKQFFEDKLVYLPKFDKGGNTVLSHLIIEKKLSILWSFFHPSTSHLSSFDNRALVRLCGVHHVNALGTTESVKSWISESAENDLDKNPQPYPLSLVLRTDDKPDQRLFVESRTNEGYYQLGYELENQNSKNVPQDKNQNYNKNVVRWNVAIAAIGKSEDKLIDLVKNYEREFKAFRKILTTNDTANRLVHEIPGIENNLYRYHSNRDGGLIELSSEALFNKCNAVILFSDDEENSFSDDIRVLKHSDRINPKIRLIQDEIVARDWLDNIVRPKRQEGLKKGAYQTGDVCQVTGVYRFYKHVKVSSKHKSHDNEILINLIKGDIFPPLENITDMIPSCGEGSYWINNEVYHNFKSKSQK